jgi:hypothetical protein
MEFLSVSSYSGQQHVIIRAFESNIHYSNREQERR